MGARDGAPQGSRCARGRGPTTSGAIDAAAKALGTRRNQCYELFRRHRLDPTVTALLPQTRGRSRGTRLLGAEVEAVIAAAIDELYLDRRCPSLADLVRETERRCAVEGLAPPSRKAVTLRTRALDRRKTLCRRGGGARARRELGRIVGRLSADRPLELVQMTTRWPA